MKKKTLIFLVLLIPCFSFTEGIKQATYILEKVTKFHKNHPKITGQFELTVNGKKQTGIFYYFHGDKNQSVKLFFGPKDVPADSQERYSFWLVDKNKLWVYLSDSKVLVEQEIPEYFNTIGILGSGLSHYFAGYKNFSIEEIAVKDNAGKENAFNRLKFSDPIKEKTAFTDMTVDITEDGFQKATRATAIIGEGKNSKKNEFSFILNKVNLNAEYNEKKVFRVNPSGNIQILRNVLMN